MSNKQADLVSRIAQTQDRIDRAEIELIELINAARQTEATWDTVGSALGIAGKTAYSKFGPRSRWGIP